MNAQGSKSPWHSLVVGAVAVLIGVPVLFGGALLVWYLAARSPGGNADPAQVAPQTYGVDSLPPAVVSTDPASGSQDVDAGTRGIRVRFSKAMMPGSWSWSTAWSNSTPEIMEAIRYEPDQRTCVMTARLEPGRTYAFWLNSERFQNFRDAEGRPAVPYLLIFETKPESKK